MPFKPLFSFHPCALIKSVSSKEINLLLDDIHEKERKQWGENVSMILLQLYEGASVILINKNGEAIAMDSVGKVGSSDENDSKFVHSCGIDASKHMYPFKCKVGPLSKMFERKCNEYLPSAADTLSLRTFPEHWSVKANNNR